MSKSRKPASDPKHKRFAMEYLVDLNATQAAIRAGYSERSAKVTGCRLLTKANIQALIQKGQEKREERTEVTQDYVINGIKQLVQRCIQAEAVVDKEGNETGEYKFEAFAALKGYELLGKHKKLFTDKVEHSGIPEIIRTSVPRPQR